MSDRLTRKEIKRDIREDEIALFIHRVFEWVGDNARKLVFGGIAIVVAAIVAVIASALLSNQREAAADALAEALDTFRAPIEGEPPPPDDTVAVPDVEPYASEEERRAKALEQFEAVHGKLGGGASRDVAGLFLADIAAESGEIDRAKALWETFANDHRGHMLGIAARLNLISLARQEGEGEALAAELRDELERGNPSLPEDILLFELARTLENLGRNEEARTYYQKIVDEHASSPYAADARTRAASQSAA